MDREQLERWLAEEAGGQDDAADAAFAHLFAAVPKVNAGPAFVEQAVTRAWQWRARRRRMVAFAWAAAVVVIAGSVAATYAASPLLTSAAAKSVAFLSGHAVPWLVAYARVALDWWWTLGRVGTVIASAMLTPARVVALVGVELFGILALFALLRVAGAGRLGDAQV